VKIYKRRDLMRIIALVVFLALAGCGGGKDSEGNQKESVFDPLVDNIDKANEVEDKVMEQKAALDQAIKDAENGGVSDDDSDDEDSED
jgi:hypothetical protein